MYLLVQMLVCYLCLLTLKSVYTALELMVLPSTAKVSSTHM